jgi:RNA polymerase sigma-70 factor (ECF subfamily)
LINKNQAEDVVQEAFIKAYRALPEFRRNASLATWLHRITFLTAIDFRRREKRNPFVEINAATTHNQVTDRNSNEHYDLPIESKELRREINRAIQLLTPLEQSIFTLRHFQSFKIKDIAMIVERSEGTVKNILFRAIRKLRKELNELNDFAVIENRGGYRSC